MGESAGHPFRGNQWTEGQRAAMDRMHGRALQERAAREGGATVSRGDYLAKPKAAEAKSTGDPDEKLGKGGRPQGERETSWEYQRNGAPVTRGDVDKGMTRAIASEQLDHTTKDQPVKTYTGVFSVERLDETAVKAAEKIMHQRLKAAGYSKGERRDQSWRSEKMGRSEAWSGGGKGGTVIYTRPDGSEAKLITHYPKYGVSRVSVHVRRKAKE